MEGARLLAWLAGDVEGTDVDWDSVFGDELPRIFNFFRYRVGDSATAEDLTSIAFEKAWRARDRYRKDRAAVSTWLLAIARNVAADHFRAARAEVPLGDDALGADEATPETEAVRRQHV